MRSPLVVESWDGTWRWFRWRGVILLVVFGVAFAGFAGGVEVSDRDLSQSNWPSHLYYSVGLFVLGGLDLGCPIGGPVWALSAIWVAYFAAPALTATAVIEGVWRTLRPHTVFGRLRRHVVIGGCGRLAMLYLQYLREQNPRQRVVIVDRDTENPNCRVASEQFRAFVVHGELGNQALLQSLRFDRADHVVLLAGDDFVNLDAASRIAQLVPSLANRITAHVSDLRLLRTLETSDVLAEVKKFNSYRTAAVHLVNELLRPHFASTPAADTVVIAGFGRFGQTVLDQLQKSASGQFEKVVLLDSDVEVGRMVFDDQVGFEKHYTVEGISEDVRHPAVWTEVEKRVATGSSEPVLVVGTGHDALNFRTALWLSRKFPHAKIVARCFETSRFTREIAEEGHFDVVSTADLLRARFHQVRDGAESI